MSQEQLNTPDKTDRFLEVSIDSIGNLKRPYTARLLTESREYAQRFNRLNAFMASAMFPQLSQLDKDLLYEQQRAMSLLLQILGKRLKRAKTIFTHE